MDFKYLYNPDNGICHPYSELVANGRSDLVPLLADELNLIKTTSIADIIARRARLAAPTASVAVETNEESSKEEKAPEAVLDAPKAKGVSVVGKLDASEPPADEIVFEDAKKDYRKYRIYGGEIFPIEELANVPDEDLVRFAKEVLVKDYEDASEFADDKERAEYYGFLREKIFKALKRINGKRVAKRAKKEADNGGND